MKLCELFLDILDIEEDKLSDTEISIVTSDSKQCIKDALFVALGGRNFDGNDYVDEAISKGAKVIVSEKDLDKKQNCLIIKVENARKILSLLSARINKNPEKSLSFIAVTGTKGKSTTSEFLLRILSLFGVNAISIGTLGVRGKINEETHNTTPIPEELFSILKRALDLGVSCVVMEMSSQALFDCRAYGIKFERAIFTNLSRDHIGGAEHKSFSEYLLSKRLLFLDYGVKKAFINRDDAYFSYFYLSRGKTYKCGFNRDSDFIISDYKECENGADFRLSGIPVSISLPGKYNASNAALALCASSDFLGVGIEKVKDSLRGVKLEGRFEIHSVKGRRVIIDYAHNADSFYRLSSLVRSLFSGRIIAVFGSVGDRGYERRRSLASAAEASFDFSVITSDDSKWESPLNICEDIYSSFFDKTKATVIPDRREAIEYALMLSKCENDTVLLLGKGHEKYLSIGGKKIAFSEREILFELDRQR
jgi:UDP-N-acetylmuramoyl-L-alanyl-D-glutamate--2,6-diaminopimelate ligase